MPSATPGLHTCFTTSISNHIVSRTEAKSLQEAAAGHVKSAADPVRAAATAEKYIDAAKVFLGTDLRARDRLDATPSLLQNIVETRIGYTNGLQEFEALSAAGRSAFLQAAYRGENGFEIVPEDLNDSSIAIVDHLETNFGRYDIILTARDMSDFARDEGNGLYLEALVRGGITYGHAFTVTTDYGEYGDVYFFDNKQLEVGSVDY